MKRAAFFVFCMLFFFLTTGFSQITGDSSQAAGTTAAPAESDQTAPAAAEPKQEVIAPEATTPANESKDTSTPGSDEITVPGKQAPVLQEEKQPASAEKPVEKQATAAEKSGEKPAEKPAEKPEEKTAAPSEPEKPSFELSAGSVTVDGQQWTRIAFGFDLPIWKFGIFFDVEAFLDQQGNFSKKGWDFKNDPLDAVMRKIRYVRFGHEEEPLFVKVGGLSEVTIGHGFIVDRFTNMLHYPDQHLLGLQFYLNDITPLGLTVQVMGADLKELRGKYEGGVGAARLAVKPLKMLDLPIISNLSVGGTYAMDRNTYAPARDWKKSSDQKLVEILNQHGVFTDTAVKAALQEYGINADSVLEQTAHEDSIKSSVAPFGIYGVDLNLPIITTSLLSLDVYAQSGRRDDSLSGWGFGAPGVALKVWRMSASVEYRHTQGRFVPGFFGPYYLDERLQREPVVTTKAQLLRDDTLNGVFGSLGFDIADVLVIGGAYQYMKGKTDEQKDQRIELTGNVGSMILGKIPKIKKLEAYLYKTNINSDIVRYDTSVTPAKPVYDAFFEKTPFFYYGYRLGFEISQGATLICDTRFGYTRNKSGKLSPNNNISVQTAFSF